MKKPLIIIITLLCLTFNLKGQIKKAHWRLCGSSFGSDTTSKTFSLDGKDSLSYKIISGPACCDLWKDYEGKIHSCKGLTLHAVSQVFWYWQLDQVYVKGKLIKSGKPYWNTSMSTASFVNGEYDFKGKQATPQYVHIPDMRGEKWVKVN